MKTYRKDILLSVGMILLSASIFAYAWKLRSLQQELMSTKLKCAETIDELNTEINYCLDQKQIQKPMKKGAHK